MLFLKRIWQRPGLSGGAVRRLVAVLIDLVVIGLLCSVFAPISYAVSDGFVRVRAMFPNAVCIDRPFTEAERRNLRIDLYGRVLQPDQIRICEARRFGYPTDGSVTFFDGNNAAGATAGNADSVLRLDVESGAVLWAKVPIDANGNLTTAVYLDFLFPLLLMLYAVFTEYRFGGTLGKALLCIRLRRTCGSKAAFRDVLIRQIWRLGPIIGVGVVTDLGGLSQTGSILSSMQTALQTASTGWIVFVIASYCFWRPDPLFDRKTGLTVVYTKPSWMAER